MEKRELQPALSTLLRLSRLSLGVLIISSFIFAALLLSGCTEQAQIENTANTANTVQGYCGDGVCTAEEMGRCSTDCAAKQSPQQKQPTELNWLEQIRQEQAQANNSQKYSPVTPDIGTPTLGYLPIEQPLPEIGFQVASRYNPLSVGENISGVMGTLTGANLPEILRGGMLQSITDAFGPRSTFYEQRLTLRSGRVSFGYDDATDKVSTYLEYNEGDPIWEYYLVMNCGILKFFEGATIHFLGHDYLLEHVSNSTITLIGINTTDQILLRNGRSSIVNGEEISTRVLNVTFSYEYLRIIVNAPDNIKILPGDILTNHIRRRVLMTNRLDLAFEGLTDSASINVNLRRTGDNYKLILQNNLGMNYSIPIARRNPFMVANDANNFIFREGASQNDFNIHRRNYLLITNNKEVGGISSLLRFVDVDEVEGLVEFEDTALEKYYVYVNGNISRGGAYADMLVYGVNHRVYVGPNKTVSVDMNGDGRINGASIPVIVGGNSLIRFSSSASQLNLTFVTPGSFRENSRSNLETRIVVDNSGISIPKSSLAMEYDSEKKTIVGMSDFGTFFILKTDVDSENQQGQEMLINQPLTQRFANVILRAFE